MSEQTEVQRLEAELSMATVLHGRLTHEAIKAQARCIELEAEVQALRGAVPALNAMAKRRIYDAIRGAYDTGYSDARNAGARAGDSAPGYKGRDIEQDHGGALLSAINTQLAAAPQPERHDELRCAVGNCTFNGEVATHTPGCPSAPQPAAQPTDMGDSLFMCASDLQHSAIYDNHLEMQSCLRAVAARIIAFATQPAAQQEPAGEPVAWMVYQGVRPHQLCGSEKHAEVVAAQKQKDHDLSGSLASFSVKPLYTRPAVQQEPADMFWNSDDADQPHDSIECFLNDQICQHDIEVGAVFTIWRAKKLPALTIRVTAIDSEECEAEYEVIEQAQTPQPAQGEKQ